MRISIDISDNPDLAAAKSVARSLIAEAKARYGERWPALEPVVVGLLKNQEQPGRIVKDFWTACDAANRGVEIGAEI